MASLPVFCTNGTLKSRDAIHVGAQSRGHGAQSRELRAESRGQRAQIDELQFAHSFGANRGWQH